MRDVTFYSCGIKVSGRLFENKTALNPSAAVVIAAGLTGVKEGIPEALAGSLSHQGYQTLIFDYRGFGESGGVRGRVAPEEQARDTSAALTFLIDEVRADIERVGVVGVSFGAGIAIRTAIADSRVKNVVTVVGVTNGYRWLKSLHRGYEWANLLERANKARIHRVRTGQDDHIDPLELLAPDKETTDAFNKLLQEYPERRVTFALESVDNIIAFQPDLDAARISPRPLLIIHSDCDTLVSVEEATTLYDHAREPKKLVLVPGATHFGLLQEPYLSRIVDHITSVHQMQS